MRVDFRELPKGLFENMKRIINGHENVTLAPISVVESVSMITFIFFFFTKFSLDPET